MSETKEKIKELIDRIPEDIWNMIGREQATISGGVNPVIALSPGYRTIAYILRDKAEFWRCKEYSEEQCKNFPCLKDCDRIKEFVEEYNKKYCK